MKFSAPWDCLQQTPNMRSTDVPHNVNIAIPVSQPVQNPDPEPGKLN